MKAKILLILLLFAGLVFVAPSCSSDSDDDTEQTDPDDNNNDGDDNDDDDGDGDDGDDDGNDDGDGDDGDDDDDDDDDGEKGDLNSQDVNFENAITIAFTSAGVTVTNPFADSGVAITETGSHVVITSTVTDKELNYIIRGATSDGSVKIYGDRAFGLVFNGTDITNPRGAAVNIQSKEDATVTVVENTRNYLCDGTEYDTVDGEDMKGTLFSEGALNFYGSGLLSVQGLYSHAICTDAYFRMYAGDVRVTTAAKDALHVKKYTRIDAGKLNLVSTGDAVDCDGYIEITGGEVTATTSGQKGHGLKSGEYQTVSGSPVLNITVNGIASKGINSKGDVTISNGTLNITTTGNAYFDTDDQDTSSAAGIKCDANVIVGGGTLTVNSSGSGGKGINVDGTLTINAGTITVTTTGDQYVYNSQHDTAAKAIKSDGNLTVNGGSITIRTSRTEAEGLESKATLTINGGDLDIEAYDDCINASNHIEITGGTVYCRSETNDAIDSNGTLTISGGTIVAVGSGQPEAGFDCDKSRFAITGGTLIGIGGSTSTPTANACTQRSVVFNSTSGNPQTINISSGSGADVLTFKVPRSYNQRMVMLFSSPDIAANTTYTITTGGTISGGTDMFHGIYSGATYSGGSSAGTFTSSSMVSSVGSGGGGGGRP